MGCFKTLSFLAVVLAVAVYGVGYYLAHYTGLSGMIPALVSHRNFDLKDLPNMKGKVVVITGANAGLGFSSAKALAGAGAHTVLACRSADKCTAAANRIRKVHPAADLATLELDLSDLASVRKFSEQLVATEPVVDVLLLNAGVMIPPHTLTADGLELQFGVNHVAHFYLALKVLPVVREAVARRGNAVITVVSSYAHTGTVPAGVYLNEAQVNDATTYDPVLWYGQSKLANILFSSELSRRLGDGAQNIFVNAVHPGAVATELTRYAKDFMPFLSDDVHDALMAGFKALAWDSDSGALTQIYASASPHIVGQRITGKYFVPVAREFPASAAAQDRDLQANVWKFTEEVLAKRGFMDYERV
jgi:NAD(P)-dependent dehydrogenase (short-subunit alcohol dehydrogenase family)